MRCRQNGGFTLVELMITMVISTIIGAALYATYILQQRSYTVQGQVTQMQQNVRAGVDFLTLDLRMAGYDPQAKIGNVGITTATSTAIAFSADMDESGDLGTLAVPAAESEYFGFGLYVKDGIPTLYRASSQTTPLNVAVTPPGAQPLADHIENIEFNYVLASGAVTNAPTAGQLPDIRSVRVSMLARAPRQDTKYVNTDTYTTASGAVWNPPDDGFRRRLIITQVDLRNMGL